MGFIKPFLYSIHKGLLLAVVLCCWLLACTPAAPSSSQPLGPPLPDPLTFFHLPTQQPLPPDSLAPSELALLQAGDVLLRKGYGWISEYIVATLEEPCAISHCGLLVKQGETLAVLHTASSQEQEGLLVEPLEEYIQQSQAHSLVAIRPKGSLAQQQQLLALAQSYSKKDIPFDYHFDDQDAQALYCVELLRDLFLEAFEQDYLPLHYARGELSLLGFQNFFDTTNFSPLFNHCNTIK